MSCWFCIVSVASFYFGTCDARLHYCSYCFRVASSLPSCVSHHQGAQHTFVGLITTGFVCRICCTSFRTLLLQSMGVAMAVRAIGASCVPEDQRSAPNLELRVIDLENQIKELSAQLQVSHGIQSDLHAPGADACSMLKRQYASRRTRKGVGCRSSHAGMMRLTCSAMWSHVGVRSETATNQLTHRTTELTCEMRPSGIAVGG